MSHAQAYPHLSSLPRLRPATPGAPPPPLRLVPPDGRPATPAVPNAIPGAAHEGIRDRTVLVVDDEEANLRLLETLLQRAGYRRVVTTQSPWHAVSLCERLRPDLLLLDLRMPGLDGFGVMEALRASPEGDRTAVLVLSADESLESRRRALAGGARDFLAKPFDCIEVLLRIRGMLELRVAHDQLQRQNEQLERRVRARTRQLRRDMAARIRAERALRSSEERFRGLVETAGDLICAVDTMGRITYANPATLRVLGYPAEELHQRPLLEVVEEEHREEVRAFYRAQVATRQEVTYREIPVRTRAGETLWLGQSARLVAEDGEVHGVYLIARDITARREVERIKDELVSVISHELRTPLTAIHGAVTLLSGGLLEKYPERGRRMLEVASHNTARLTRLVNDILEVERLASGRVRVERRPYAVGALVSQASDAVRALAEGGQVWLVPTLLDAKWEVDPDRICQLLINLLSNAIKFSPRGGTVWLGGEVTGEGLHLWVRDQGRGIPADKVEMVFERFQQVDSSDAREKGGTGLGLSICRSITELHGGRIWAESAPGAGSTFHVVIPPGPAADAAPDEGGGDAG